MARIMYNATKGIYVMITSPSIASIKNYLFFAAMFFASISNVIAGDIVQSHEVDGLRVELRSFDDSSPVQVFANGKLLAEHFGVSINGTRLGGNENSIILSVSDGSKYCSDVAAYVTKKAGKPATYNEDECDSDAIEEASENSLNFEVRPKETWTDLNLDKIESHMDLFGNGDVFARSKQILGKDFVEVLLSLRVSSGFENSNNGWYLLKGCFPHACGASDAAVAIHLDSKKLFFVQKNGEEKSLKHWPNRKSWPQEALKLESLLDDGI